MNYLNVGKSDLGGIKVVYTSQISYPLFKKKLNAGVLIHKLPSSALHPKKNILVLAILTEVLWQL